MFSLSEIIQKNLTVTNSKNPGVLVGSCEVLSLWPREAMIYVEPNYYVPSDEFRKPYNLRLQIEDCAYFRARLFPIAVRGCE